MRTGNSFAEQRRQSCSRGWITKFSTLSNKKVADKDRVMRSPWVLTWKSTGKAKARLRVFWLSRSRPDRSSSRQCVASNKWKLVSGDIKTAFFSEDEEHRNIFILPPDDVRDILKLSPESLLRLRKAVYGLVNARRNGGNG